MEKSYLPIRIFMMAITLITTTKEGFSSSELQKQQGIKRYEPIYRIYHKLKAVIGKSDDRSRLKNMFKNDEAYLEKSNKAQVRSELKREWGTQKQSKVDKMTESKILKDPESGKFDKSYRYFKMEKMKELGCKNTTDIDQKINWFKVCTSKW